MTVRELIVVLEAEYKPDDDVYIGFEYCGEVFPVDRVIVNQLDPILEAVDVPEFDDVCKIANQCYLEHKLTPLQKSILEPMLD